jgi:tRNA-specific 2-thiouridylase
MAKVLVAMSGGVDSSLSAYLLLQQGYEVIGATMNFLEVPSPSIKDAKAVAEQLRIPHYVFNLQGEFQRKVLKPFLLGYSKGVTPNPCVLCNRMIKFGVLWEKANELGCSYIATGHYARISSDEKGRKVLLKGRAKKEQSYFLYNIKAELLDKILFPLGDWDKEMVREKAREIGLAVADKEESKDLCFVRGDYRDLLRRHFPDAFKEGAILDSEGRFLGFHKGIANYTIGQREGLGIALGERYYVKEIRAEENIIVVGREEEIEAREIWADNLNWLSELPKEGETVGAKIRYGSPEKPAKIFWDGELLRVEFLEPVRAPALGQSVVLYRDEIVLGGGIICRISWLR